MSLKDFCEHVIIALNGNCKHLYQLTLNDEESYLGDGCSILLAEQEEMIQELM